MHDHQSNTNTHATPFAPPAREPSCVCTHTHTYLQADLKHINNLFTDMYNLESWRAIEPTQTQTQTHKTPREAESANRRKTPEPLVNTCRLASLCPMTCFDVYCMFCLVVFVYCLHTKSGHVNVKGPARTLRWARGHLCSNLVQWCTRALHQSAALSSCRATFSSLQCHR